MKKIILLVLSIILLPPFTSSAQVQVLDGKPMDSTIIRFTSDTISNYFPDTAAVPLWQIGHSHKSFFGIDTIGETTIMTDTLHHYRVKANNWFVIKFPRSLNTIVDFWHKYQTDSSHAGGIVEFSLDHQVSWMNVMGICNRDTNFAGHGVITTSFYGFTDTLRTGEPSFSGKHDSLRYSRFQLFDGFPERTTGGTYCDFAVDTYFVRFRFVSDTTADTLAGWEIDSVKIEYDNYGSGGVMQVNKRQSLNIYPNPSNNGTFYFPSLNNEQNFSIEVYNTIGGRILRMPYKQSLDIGNYAKGLYFYKVSDGMEYYSGRLLIK